MKHDIVYVIGSGSKWENNELRFSLRSLEKHFEHGNVFIVGVLPDWIQNVIHIDVQDAFPNINGGKYKNVMRKIHAACTDDRVSESFVLMNDDFFFLRDCAEIQPYSFGTLEGMIERYSDKKSQYYNALVRTMRFLKKADIENPKNYAVHYPIVYEKEKFLRMTEEVEWLENPCSWRTIYGNLFNVGGVEWEDQKKSSPDSFEKFLLQEDLGDFLSISNNIALNPAFQEWIEKMFPEKSSYERFEYERPRRSRRLR